MRKLVFHRTLNNSSNIAAFLVYHDFFLHLWAFHAVKYIQCIFVCFHFDQLFKTIFRLRFHPIKTYWQAEVIHVVLNLDCPIILDFIFPLGKENWGESGLPLRPWSCPNSRLLCTQKKRSWTMVSMQQSTKRSEFIGLRNCPKTTKNLPRLGYFPGIWGYNLPQNIGGSN